MRTAVVTDNNGGIYEEEGKKLGVRVVSMPILVNEEICFEGRGLTINRLFEEMEKGTSVTTSQPSPADISWTGKLRQACDIMNIQLLDHIIVTDDSFYSFNEEKSHYHGTFK